MVIADKDYRCVKTGDVIGVNIPVHSMRIKGTIVCPSYQDVCGVSKAGWIVTFRWLRKPTVISKYCSEA